LTRLNKIKEVGGLKEFLDDMDESQVLEEYGDGYADADDADNYGDETNVATEKSKKKRRRGNRGGGGSKKSFDVSVLDDDWDPEKHEVIFIISDDIIFMIEFDFCISV
jgi:hypothetical protein